MSDEKVLIGKTVKEVDISDFGVNIVFTDGTMLDYDASDGDYLVWNIITGQEVNK